MRPKWCYSLGRWGAAKRPGAEFMLGTRFSQSVRLGFVLLLGGVFAAPGESSAPPFYPAAMSMDYNPLLWQGDDARFALDIMHSSHCTAEASKTIAAKTQNPAVQSLALTMAHEQEKLYRQLRTMAQTFNFPLPRRRELDDCPAASRIAELSGQEADSDYIKLLLSSTAANVSLFEAEVARPRVPSNWSLWKLAQKDLVMIRSEKAAVKNVQETLPNRK